KTKQIDTPHSLSSQFNCPTNKIPFLISLSLSLSLWHSTTLLHSPISPFMASDRGRPLPKFGEWDASNPASAEGFTVIFNKARDEKKTKAGAGKAKIVTPVRNDVVYTKPQTYQYPRKRKWLCFVCQ
ncbi:AvrRpt-cleavage domain-containing protein, partial [Cephalotus follicularis]